MLSLYLPARGARVLFAGIALLLAVVEFLPLYTGGYQYEVAFLAVHVGTTTAIAFLAIGVWRRREAGDAIAPADVVLIVIALVCAGYFVTQGQRIAERIEGVDAVYPLDYVFGIALIVVLLEACRRVAGRVLTAVAVLFIAYIFLGPYLPDAIAHRGLSLKRFVDLQVLSTSAIFGTPISASAHMVFYFVMVGAFLERSGAGKLFVDVAHGLTARSWGGAGKAAVVSSGLIGTVSGSAVANVLLSGLMTIPLMKRSGFGARLAGAIEATASTGGQLAPPIMGAAAFVLADIVGVSYAEVVFAAITPALLYYVSVFMLVHFYSLRNGLKPDLSRPFAESIAGLKARWHLLMPLGVMIYLLISRFSLMTVGAYTTLLIIAVSLLRKATRMNPKAIFEALLNGARAAAEVAVPSAVAGIIVGTLVQTGMALKLQRWLLDLAGNSLAISLAGAMVLTIVLGMGMPTTAAYLVSAILVAPALQELGIPALAAHLFILYFGILSMVTPPVALSAYAAAGISGANLWSTGLLAFLLAVPGFLIPYAFAINPALLLQGTVGEIIPVTLSALAGVVGFAAASGGYAFGRLAMALRVALFAFSSLLIAPDRTADLIGLIGLGAIAGYQLVRQRTRVTGPRPAGED
ncbi:MAG: TRAP transporter permease [Gammaproteobacteria bacterium]